MKVFALGVFAKPLTDEQRKRMLPKEVPDTLRLYLDGKIDQFWFREDKPGGVVFLMNSKSVKEAKSISGRHGGTDLQTDVHLHCDGLPVTLLELGRHEPGRDTRP